MIKRYSKNEAIKKMNALGKKRIPFFFLIDFEMKKIIIHPNFLDQSDILFDFTGGCTDGHPFLQYFEITPISRKDYVHGFERVQAEIQKGNSYLLNLTYPTEVKTDFSLSKIYHSVKAKYKVLLKGEFVCFSPEIFVKIKKGVISSYPMKGTIDASLPGAEKIIMEDTKEKAEHATIVDFVRNDLSRVSTNVRVNKYRYIEKINTSHKQLLQVSSEIQGHLPKYYHNRIGSIMFDLLPAASISGAPKAESLRIIREVESRQRGYYTGICGFFDGANLNSGVMIRYVEKANNGQLYYRSGGGITHMSQVDDEYKELIDKIYLPIPVSKGCDTSHDYYMKKETFTAKY